MNCFQYKNDQLKQCKCKLLNSQLTKLKSAIKNATEVFLRLSSNKMGDSNNVKIKKFQSFVRIF